jgi:hypothetical protein
MANDFSKVSSTLASARMFLVEERVFRVLPSFTIIPELILAKFLRISKVRLEILTELVFVFVVIINISLSCIVVFHISPQMILLIVTAAALVLLLHALSCLLGSGITAIVIVSVVHLKVLYVSN